MAKKKPETEVVGVPLSSSKAVDLPREMMDKGPQRNTESCSSSRTSEVIYYLLSHFNPLLQICVVLNILVET